jgi:ABC-type antimicrobial peptide transport system, permease component
MSILYSENIQNQLGSMKKFITLFNVGAVMIGLFSAFFIWYSNSFFIKSRKKEFATYMLLGMSKKHVARLNFFENTIIMILSLFTGIICGLIFTKFFIMLLFYMIKTSAVVYFQWNFRALKVSLIIFFIIYMIIVLHGAFLIRKNNLIDLFNASKKVEKGLKVSILTFLFGIIGVGVIVYGYYLAIKKLPSNIFKAPLVVALVIIGTILIFVSTISLIIYLQKKNERNLFRGINIISTSQLYYRYRGNVGTLSTIAISTTIALCALVTCFGTYSKAEENSRYMRPFSLEYFSSEKTDKQAEEIIKSHSEVSVKYQNNIELLNAKFIDPLINQENEFYIIKESEFDLINKEQKVDRKAGLKNKNDCFFIQMQSFQANEEAVGKSININIGNREYNLNIIKTDMKPFIALDHFKQTVIVKDSVYDNMKKNISPSNISKITGFILNNDVKMDKLYSDLSKSLPQESNMLTFYDHYQDGLKLLGMMAFIGLFIGILFVTATGSIIYFKMSMEAREDKNKYLTLNKIGVSKKEIRNAVSKELVLLFGAPLLLAAANSYPATIALGKMLSLKLVGSYIVILLVYACIYCLYYFITLNSYMKTINE